MSRKFLGLLAVVGAALVAGLGGASQDAEAGFFGRRGHGHGSCGAVHCGFCSDVSFVSDTCCRKARKVRHRHRRHDCGFVSACSAPCAPVCSAPVSCAPACPTTCCSPVVSSCCPTTCCPTSCSPVASGCSACGVSGGIILNSSCPGGVCGVPATSADGYSIEGAAPTTEGVPAPPAAESAPAPPAEDAAPPANGAEEPRA